MAGAQVVRRLVGVYDMETESRRPMGRALDWAREPPDDVLYGLTHDGWQPRADWAALLSTIAVPFDLVYLDEREPAVAEASEGLTPCVVAVTDTGAVVVLGRPDLEAAGSYVLRFDQTLREAADAEALMLPLV
ncbi:hypothetical protein [Yinghuangia seranimata]|uniref:hypothetical protein n=1 Tax=Yinghuangia seranimata TaxID=408067 RepID=UPI00248A9AE1|nr:hypothetical protein [Yinghuangia seranimata]MDI2127527.1 hypothetical protein [Yinghuangia seranimata]